MFNHYNVESNFTMKILDEKCIHFNKNWEDLTVTTHKVGTATENLDFLYLYNMMDEYPH